MSEGGKLLGDLGAVGIMLGTFAQILPSLAAFLTVLWLAIRIWESETVRLLTRRPPARKPYDD